MFQQVSKKQVDVVLLLKARDHEASYIASISGVASPKMIREQACPRKTKHSDYS